MDFFDVVKKRRSIRRFTSEKLSDEIVNKAIDAALLAPNSSNVQTWDFHWIRSESIKEKVVEICLGQSAARTSSGLVILSADPKKWRRAHVPLLKWVQDAGAPVGVQKYYDRLIPLMYRWGIFNIWGFIKSLGSSILGLFRPVLRGPFTRRDLQEVAMKSAALAAENFVLAITAQGGATCMMEGFDEVRMKRLLQLPSSARVVMAIAYGYEAERGTWAPQYRLPKESVLRVL